MVTLWKGLFLLVWKYLYSTRLIIYDPYVQMTTLTLLLQPLILNTIADELVYKKNEYNTRGILYNVYLQ